MLSALVARVPITISGLAIVLFLEAETGSYSVAGAVAGAMSLGTGVFAPLMGRLVDRQGDARAAAAGGGERGGAAGARHAG